MSEAIKVGETATSVLYGQKAAHLNLGLAYQSSGDFVRSVKSLETALQVSDLHSDTPCDTFDLMNLSV